jgi:uncharacterized protein YpmB
MNKISDVKRGGRPDFRKEKIIDLKKINSQKKETAGPEPMPEPEAADKTVFWWTMAEDQKIQRGLLWYLATAAASIAVIVFAIVQKNWLFLIFIILAIIAYYLVTSRKPAKRLFKIDAKGLTIDDKQYDFKEITGFSTHKKLEQNYLVFEVNRLGQKYLIIPFKKDGEKMAAFLRQHLAEKQYEESFSDALRNFLGF